MTRILIDQAMLNKLNQLSEPVELCDATGRVLARVLPAHPAEDFEPSGPQVSEEELLRRSKARAKGRSTEEILKRLEQL